MATHNEKKPALDPKPLNILYVEDTPADAELCLHDLKKAGYEPHADVVSTACDFVAKLRSKPYDVILSDNSLPQFSAMEALELVKEEAPDLPFILVTGTLGDEGAVEAIKQGATDYVLKDRRARLASSVRRALEEKKTLQQQRKVEEALRESEAKFRALAESVPQMVWVCTPDGLNVYFSQRWVDYTGLTLEESYGRGWNTPFHPDDKQPAWKAWNHALATGDTYSIECRLRRADNTYHWFLTRGVPLRDDAGNIVKWFGTCTDIEDMKRADDELRRLNRALKTISECNQALVHAHGEQELLDAVCQILVDKGGYHLVKACYTAPDDPAQVRSVAHAGSEEAYIASVHQSPGEAVHACWPCEEAIQSRQVCIARATSIAPQHKAWLELATHYGIASTIALPLQVNGHSIGAITLYATELDAFDDAEVKLLAELADDLAYGIQSLRTRIEHKRAEAEVRTARDQWELTFNTVPDPILVLDSECRIARANRAAAALAGLKPQDVLGKKCHEVLHGQCEPRADCPHQTLLQTGQYAQGDIYEAWLDKFFASTATPLYDHDGLLRGCVHVLHDVTARRRAEDDLRHSEKLFEVFMNNSPAIAWMKDAEGQYVYCNKRFESSFHVKQADVIGKTDAELWPAEIAQKQRDDDLAVLTSGKSMEFNEPIPDPNVEREAWVTKFPFRDPLGRELVGGKAIEITEHKRLEAQFRQSQKMEAIGQLAGGVAHDFNNLLTIISGYSELLGASLGKDAPQLEQVKQIQVAADRAAGLTHQLLAFGRRQTMAAEVLDLNSVVARAEKMLRRLIGENIELITQSTPELGHVKADPGQIEQVIMNLVVNARDAMPQGGKLTVETANVEITSGDLRFDKSVKPGSYIGLRVADSGWGIAPDVMPHIFEPFFTTKEKGKGTGLGLATVYGIVQQSGGAISMKSELGRGTTFHVLLPRVEVNLAPEVPAPIGIEHRPSTETVLVVEDEESLRKMVEGILEACGYNVLEATNGAEALSLCENYAGPIHLLLTDVVMPQMGGQELAVHLTSRRPHLRVLYMSGYTNGTITLDDQGDVKQAFIAKPFTPRALASRVREILDVSQSAREVA